MKRNINKGEFVQIVAKVEYANGQHMRWNTQGKMDILLNNGNWYEVTKTFDGRATVDCGGFFWNFLYECLSDSVKGIPNLNKKNKAKKPAPKKVKPPKVKTFRYLRSELERRVKEEAGDKISSYAIKLQNGKVNWNVNDVCYYRLKFYGCEPPPKEVAVSLGNAERIIGKKRLPIYRKYTKYILDSPAWGAPFLTRNVAVAFRYGMYMDVTQPLSRIVASLTALREGVEFCDKLSLFGEALNRGYSGDVAYLLSTLFGSDGKGGYKISSLHSGHKIINKFHSLKGIVNFLTNGYRNLKEKPYTEQYSNFSCQEAVCNISTRSDLVRDIKKHCKVEINGDGWGKSEIITEESLFKFADVLTKMIGQK